MLKIQTLMLASLPHDVHENKKRKEQSSLRSHFHGLLPAILQQYTLNWIRHFRRSSQALEMNGGYPPQPAGRGVSPSEPSDCIRIDLLPLLIRVWTDGKGPVYTCQSPCPNEVNPDGLSSPPETKSNCSKFNSIIVAPEIL
ncbi:hypothetical protein [Janthinobacterium sp. JC611]|uniref:hypothetical protein n=1 Tax=Janthinobacterium sp. JC611 TaxID=2816201 RepID=UPI001BFE7F38|nr:hypothetical protein [Janthinobacterium sp. JC611]